MKSIRWSMWNRFARIKNKPPLGAVFYWVRMAISVNDLLQLESIRHQVALQGYTTNVLHRLLAVLNRSDKRLMAELAEKLADFDPTLFSMERLESLLTSVRAMSAATYAELGQELTKELREFVGYELSYQHQMLTEHLPVVVHVAAVSAEQVYAAAMARPFQGVLLKGVWADLDANKMKKVRQAIAQGFVEGKTTDQIIRELRGTRAKGYSDGIIERDRRDVEAVVRTAVAHTAGVAQDNVMQANTDLLRGVMWSSTIDMRTTKAICVPRDRKLYTADTHQPIGHKMPWLQGPGRAHWRCFPAGTKVAFAGDLKRVYKRWFDGDLVVLRTASGNFVSCTPNHPILTDRGWVAAELIDLSSKVVSNGIVQGVSAIHNKADYVPALIEDVVHSFLESGHVLSMEVPTSTPDFHGDGVDGDVAVVGTNRGLLVANKPASRKHVAETALGFGDSLAPVSVPCGGVFDALTQSPGATFGCGIRGSNKALDGFGAAVAHPGVLLLGAVARGEAKIQQVSGDDFGRSSEMLGDTCDTSPSFVKLCDGAGVVNLDQRPGHISTVLFEDALDHLKGDAMTGGYGLDSRACIESRNDGSLIKLRHVAPNGDASALEHCGDSRDAVANILRDVGSRLPGGIFLDDVVEVGRTRFSGHVYNLETESGDYIANGIVSHNCRSGQVPVLKSYKELGIDLPEIEVNGRTRASMDGQLPADTSYADWIKKQSAARQDEVLGPTRGRLLRQGGLEMADLYSARGELLTLDDLRKRDAEAFKRAGM